MSTTKDTIISTPELLELTLIHLPMRDLLVTTPLVCKMWQAGITLTPALQRTLFFQPDPSASAPIQNPLLVELFPPFCEIFYPSQCSRTCTASSITTMPWSKASEAFRRVDASWRRMLVTQPPVQTLLVKQTRHSRRGSSVRRAVLRDLSLTMGTLYDLAVPFIIGFNDSSFRVRWHLLGSNDAEVAECDLTLSVKDTVSCVRWPGRRLSQLFESDGRKDAGIDFGEWLSLSLGTQKDSDDEEEDS
ncbi:F-box domain protein [Mycena venus]|uniref:F-box domain protein n=1 Tax=Mycena venus TaxID=2733690 RepID=A0A8H6YGC8_9AGAR|nr:F-box domain protein [Mycena venus]